MRGLRPDEYAVLDAALWNDRLPCDEECSEEEPFSQSQEGLVASMVERGLVVQRFCPHSCDEHHPGLTNLGRLAMRVYEAIAARST